MDTCLQYTIQRLQEAEFNITSLKSINRLGSCLGDGNRFFYHHPLHNKALLIQSLTIQIRVLAVGSAERRGRGAHRRSRQARKARNRPPGVFKRREHLWQDPAYAPKHSEPGIRPLCWQDAEAPLFGCWRNFQRCVTRNKPPRRSLDVARNLFAGIPRRTPRRIQH